MRVLSIATDYAAGGSARSLLNMLRGLRERGAEVMAVVPREDYLTARLDEAGIPYVINPWIRITVWPPAETMRDLVTFVPHLAAWSLWHRRARRMLTHTATTFRPDIIHTNVSLYSVGRDVALKLGIPHVWHIREYGAADFKRYFFPTPGRLRRLLAEGPTIGVTRGIRSHFGLDQEQCRVIYNGIRPAHAAMTDVDKEPYFLFVGHINPKKGVTDMIEAFIAYRKQGGKSRLLIAGPWDHDPAYHSRLTAMAAQAGISGDVEFLGLRDDVDQLMRKARALVVPSLHEAFGRITAEAMFNGCPVLGRYTAGTREQFDLCRRDTGIDPGISWTDNARLTAAMAEADAMTPDQLSVLGKTVNRFAADNFSNEANAQAIHAYFTQIISRQG